MPLHDPKRACPRTCPSTAMPPASSPASLPAGPLVRGAPPLARRAPAACRLAAIPTAPLLAVSGALAAACGYVFRAPIFSKALSMWLGARVTVASVGYEPFQGGRWTFGRTRMVDRRGRPLCSFDSASIASYEKRVESSRGVRRQTQYVVDLDRPEVAACFDSFAVSSSNWSEWASRFRPPASLTSAEAEGRKDEHRSDDSHAGGPAGGRPTSPRVQLNVKHGLMLSLRYSGALTGKTNHVINDVLLTDLDGVGDDLLSPASTARLVERLAARAIKSASYFRFDNAHIRTAARGYARRTLRTETRSMRALARVHVRRLRKNIAFADEFLAGLPDTQHITDAAKTGDTVLSQIESWLKMLDRNSSDSDPDSDEQDGGRGQLTDNSSRQRAERALPPAAEDKSENQGPLAPSPPPAPKYLELDEEWVTSSDSSAPKPHSPGRRTESTG